MASKHYEIVLSSVPGDDYLIERLVGTAYPEYMPGKKMTQDQVDHIDDRKFKVTIVRRK